MLPLLYAFLLLRMDFYAGKSGINPTTSLLNLILPKVIQKNSHA